MSLGIRSGGARRFCPRSKRFRAPCSHTITLRFRCMAISRRSNRDNTSQSTFSWVERPVSHSRSQGSEVVWMTSVATWRSNFAGLLAALAPAGSSGRTSPVCSRWTEGELSPPSSEGWQNAGMVSPTECWTLSLSEWTDLDGLSLSDDGVCSLSDILETGDVPQRYFLSARACLGILRRAARRGKDLPQLLARALRAVAGSEPTSTATEV